MRHVLDVGGCLGLGSPGTVPVFWVPICILLFKQSLHLIVRLGFQGLTTGAWLTVLCQLGGKG